MLLLQQFLLKHCCFRVHSLSMGKVLSLDIKIQGLPWTLGNQVGFKVHSCVQTLGSLSRTLRGAGFSSILCATVYVLLHGRLIIIQLLTGEIVQFKKPAGLYNHVGAGVARNSILGNGLDDNFCWALFSFLLAYILNTHELACRRHSWCIDFPCR